MPGHPAQSLVSSAPTELIGQGRLPVNIAIDFGNADAKVSFQTSVITLNANVLLILCVLISIEWCGLVGCSPYSAVQGFNTTEVTVIMSTFEEVEESTAPPRWKNPLLNANY